MGQFIGGEVRPASWEAALPTLSPRAPAPPRHNTCSPLFAGKLYCMVPQQPIMRYCLAKRHTYICLLPTWQHPHPPTTYTHGQHAAHACLQAKCMAAASMAPRERR